MTTLEPKPNKTKALNSTTLTIAGILLIVLALLFLASPLLGLNRGLQRAGNFNRLFNGQNGTGGQNFPAIPSGGTGNGQRFFGQGGTGNGFPGQGGTNFPGQQVNRTGLLGLGFLRGTTSLIIFGVGLLISLAAFIGMLSVKTWGKILGILMAVIYLLLAVLSFLPLILFSRFGVFSNPLSIILNILHVVLALGVIVFALIPARKALAPAAAVTPPAAV